MACSYKSSYCRFILVFVLLQQSVSFSVEDLCARRCLYGRGGVLCNCNARHFSGKRSQMSAPQKMYTKGHGLTFSDSDMKDEDLDRETSSLSSYGHDIGPANSDLKYLLDGQPLDNILVTLRDSFAPGLHSRFHGNNKMAVQSNTNFRLPIIVISAQEKERNEDDNGELAERTRQEIVAKIRQIMAVPFLATDGRSNSETTNTNNRGYDESDVFQKQRVPRQRLMQLQSALTGAPQER